jgi:hypothetical protein
MTRAEPACLMQRPGARYVIDLSGAASISLLVRSSIALNLANEQQMTGPLVQLYW